MKFAISLGGHHEAFAAHFPRSLSSRSCGVWGNGPVIANDPTRFRYLSGELVDSLNYIIHQLHLPLANYGRATLLTPSDKYSLLFDLENLTLETWANIFSICKKACWSIIHKYAILLPIYKVYKGE